MCMYLYITELLEPAVVTRTGFLAFVVYIYTSVNPIISMLGVKWSRVM